MSEKYFYVIHPQSLGGGRTLVTPQFEQISEDKENRYYIEYLAWVAKGNTADEWEPNE
jgi:hypothetical protein